MNSNTGLWVQALRSGRYKQAQGRIRESSRFPWPRNSFCAMGVLYDVYLRSCGNKWPKAPLGRAPTDVREWAGVSRGLEETVVMHNDQGTGFRDIASLIEAHFARLTSARQYKEAARIAEQAIERVREISQRHRTEEIVVAPTRERYRGQTEELLQLSE